MNFDAARNVKRPTIRAGRKYEFYSTVRDAWIGKDRDKGLYRSFTGQRVHVLAQTFKPGHDHWVPGESERLYRVRADDGTEFEAYQGELSGWYKDTGQFYGPGGTYGLLR